MYIWILRKKKWDGSWKPDSASFNRDKLLAGVKRLKPKDYDITSVPVIR